MPDHDIVTSHLIDDGHRIVCRCQRIFTGPEAREEHRRHHDLETNRAELDRCRQALKGEQ